ncbi:MAG TPA: NADH-quinone oxidoreductase subunit NuoI [Candidatus Sumerlaeota bacterium]|nr:MAG: NADH-quinone oxidoreductase subunit 9 [candidate division BRC1 bacterium ADurb.BinA292]HOE95859.1 NADH-quinone oxidoreductase subunit NuoI [Candidatus Sumerlaeota bacterium]HOR26662.1 NADH-quinone oxidoreductase subunit NuoI [Candidatus Sumerlaeota bacterium]HPK03040.1 NADH-quinone oxidoreductase subunit NuoI [Candidatus Sumerlaeota bacterium]
MLVDLFKGFAVTFKHIFRPRVTLEYPEVKRPLPPYFRGRHRLQRYENGLERCVGCALCAAVCPSEAIYLEAAENDPANPVSAGERYARVYQIHQLRCIWCGFCEEACPEDAIVMGPDFELANYRRDQFICDKQAMLDPPDKGFGKEPNLKVNTAL